MSFGRTEDYSWARVRAWQTIDSFARRNPKLKGKIGAHAVLHTHNRKLGYHPHVHLIVPAGVVNREAMQWRSKQGKYLFNESNLAKVFRAKMFNGIRRLGFASDGFVISACCTAMPKS